MTRNHRRWHAWVWLMLGPILAGGFVVGLLTRPTPATEPAPLAAPGEIPNVGSRPLARETTP